MNIPNELRKIAESSWFQTFIILVIVAAGILVGVQTYDRPGFTVHEWSGRLDQIDTVILWIFVAEIVIKMGAEGRRPHRYFYDPWNIFDFVIVAACFLPFDAEYVAVVRLLRLLRVIKLIGAVPKLQILVTALLKSIPSMFYVSVLLGLLFYVYACAAVFSFGVNDPVHFGELPTAMLSLFRVVTGEDWTDVMYINMHGCMNYGYEGMEELCVQSKGYPLYASLFFVSFMIIGAMVILNLFIGVIMNGMDEAGTELEALKNKLIEREPPLDSESLHEPSKEERIAQLADQLKDIQQELAQLSAISD